MAVFVPFRAFRPSTRENLKAVTSKPYDVLSAREAREEAEGNDRSFYHVVKPEIDFEEGQDPFAPEVYTKGKENLEKMIREGILVQDEKERFYVYRIQMGDHVQTGLVGCCSIDDYFNSVIKKHELTNLKVQESRMKHITTSHFIYEPVFFAYLRNEEINQIIKEITMGREPMYGFTSSDFNYHTLWAIDDKETIERIIRIFGHDVNKIYIADGHHRTAAGAMAGEQLRRASNGQKNNRYSDLMCVLFPHDQVHIMDYNRLIKDLNGLSNVEFLAQIRENFQVEEWTEAYRPESQQTIGMYLDGKWYKLKAREGTFDPDDLIDHLGFTILSNHILEPILNIQDLRTDRRIAFVGGIRGLGELVSRVDNGEMKVAFTMHPISMAKIMEIADRGMLLPPKVTWFEPKLRSGIFVHSLNGLSEIK